MAKAKKSGLKKSKSKLGSFWTTEDRPSKKKDVKRAVARKLKRASTPSVGKRGREENVYMPGSEQGVPKKRSVVKASRKRPSGVSLDALLATMPPPEMASGYEPGAVMKRLKKLKKQAKRQREEEKHSSVPTMDDLINQTLAVHAASSSSASSSPPAAKRARSSGPKPKKQISEETKARLRALKSARKTKTDFSDGAALKGLKYLTRKGKPVTLGIAFLHMKARYNGVTLDSLLAKLTSLVKKGDVIYHPGVNQAKREPRYSLAK